MSTFVLTVTCRSTRGVVAAIAGYLADNGCNISDSAQFDDQESGRFFTRITVQSQTGVALSELKEGFRDIARKFDMTYDFHDAAEKMKVLIFVSRFGHCL